MAGSIEDYFTPCTTTTAFDGDWVTKTDKLAGFVTSGLVIKRLLFCFVSLDFTSNSHTTRGGTAKVPGSGGSYFVLLPGRPYDGNDETAVMSQ